MASENSKYYVGGTTVYGPRVHGHQKDRVEIASIAQATQPPGTWADDRIDAIKLLSDALNVKDTTGKAPRELAGENAILSARVEVLERERDEARKAILSYGNGADFDWNVLGRIDDLERESGEFRDLIQELEYALTSPSRQFCDVTRDEMAPWVRDAAALLAKHAGEPGGVQ